MNSAYHARKEVDQLLDGLFTNNWSSPFEEMGKKWKNAALLPRSDISETKASYDIAMELPGMTDADIDISIDGDILTVKGEKRSTETKEKKNYHYSERSYGSFERSVKLPHNAIAEGISATFNDGVLEIKISKKVIATTPPKKISLSKKKTVKSKKK